MRDVIEKEFFAKMTEDNIIKEKIEKARKERKAIKKETSVVARKQAE